MGLLKEQLRGQETSRPDRRALREIEEACDSCLEELEDAIKASRLNGGDIPELAEVRSRLVEETNRLTGFFDELQRSSSDFTRLHDYIADGMQYLP